MLELHCSCRKGLAPSKPSSLFPKYRHTGQNGNRSWCCDFPRAVTRMAMTLPRVWCTLMALVLLNHTACSSSTDVLVFPFSPTPAIATPRLFFPAFWDFFGFLTARIKLLDLALKTVPGVSYTKLLFFNRDYCIVSTYTTSQEDTP